MRDEVAGTEYEGFFSDFYDVLHTDAPEVEAYARLAREQAGPMLELGCGTGRLVIPLARAGHDVWGLDLYADMLAVLRRRLGAEPTALRERVTVVEGDTRDFTLARSFALVTAPCNFLDNLLTAEDLVRTFACVARHLDDDGLFVIDSSAPDLPTMVAAHGKEQVSEYVHPATGRRIVGRFTPRFDFVRQVEMDEIYLVEYEGDAVCRRARTTMTMTWHHPREVELALEAAGLRLSGTYGSLDRAPLTDASRDVVLFARRAGRGGS